MHPSPLLPSWRHRERRSDPLQRGPVVPISVLLLSYSNDMTETSLLGGGPSTVALGLLKRGNGLKNLKSAVCEGPNRLASTEVSTSVIAETSSPTPKHIYCFRAKVLFDSSPSRRIYAQSYDGTCVERPATVMELYQKTMINYHMPGDERALLACDHGIITPSACQEQNPNTGVANTG